VTRAMTVGEALRTATQRLRASGSRSPRLDAELLLAAVLGVERADLLRAPERWLDEEVVARFERVVRRREAREPVAYIRGRRAFRTLDLEVTPDVLIPRPETETVVEVALELLAAPGAGEWHEPLVLDVGTGSGCIALALAAENPYVHVVASDVSPAALAVARRNAARHGLEARVELVAADVFDGVPPGPYDLIVSNPPYVPDDEYARLEPNVREYEPEIALRGGRDGLDVVQRLVDGAPPLLRPGGALVLEVGQGQAEVVAALLAADGRYGPAMVRADLAGVARVVAARRASGTAADLPGEEPWP